ncbi:MAG: beta-propeller fold lactonase family protein [Planctomycetes bacterium]|nr:beta-propeller fold lactonase family protein [Planctomycetota bacterium]
MNQRLALALAGLSALTLINCGGSSSSSSSGANAMDLVQISNGRGLMVPHQAFKIKNGVITQEVVLLRKEKDLLANVTASNPVLPTTEWPVDATLPNGDAGNHFVFAEFTRDIDIDSVMSANVAAGVNSQLTGAIYVIAIDPSSGSSVPVKGRAFIGGKTYAGTPVNGEYPLQTWVKNQGGKPVAVDVDGATPGLGFPGTESLTGFTGSNVLASPRTFVFVVDDDGDLATHETFPANRQIRIVASTSVRSSDGSQFVQQAVGSTTVGPDTLPIEVATTPPPAAVPDTDPSFNNQDVDPQTSITVRFTEPLQPWTFGPLPTTKQVPVFGAAAITFGPSASTVNVPFTMTPVSIYDFTSWVMKPSFSFPGSGPAFFQCDTFNKVSVTFKAGAFADTSASGGALGSGNVNTLGANTHFFTGEGPGLVNAPVTPGAIIVARSGAQPGLSVIDLNGFGQGCGNPTFIDYFTFAKGNSNFPNNPNLRFQSSLLKPPLVPGDCTVNGGSAGPYTLALDSSLNDLLVRPPIIESIGDMAIGWSLDLVYNNGLDSLGCQSSLGGNLCSILGKKQVVTAFSTSTTLGPPGTGQIPAAFVDGGANPISWEPHPNPPPLVFPPLCVSPYIGGQEPTSTEISLTVTNLLVPGGNPIGDPLNGVPPTSPLAKLQNSYFVGPGLPGKTSVAQCPTYQMRQQIGHFLYMADRGRREIVVFNSNRMTVVERIAVPDPTDLAMGPNLDFLAVSNQNADSVTFIDINPTSSNFHRVVKTVKVGRAPRGIAWDPGNEDILCCNELDNSVSIISAFDFNVRKTVQSSLNRPFDIVITQRQQGFGFLRNVYFAWILNRTGTLALFESGPNGVNGWGYDDVIGVTPFKFANPKKLAVDFGNLGGSIWVVHENQLTSAGAQTGNQGGAVTNVVVDSAIFGTLPLNFTSLSTPQLRDMSFKVGLSVGPSQLTGVPVDIALDDLANLGAMQNLFPQQAAGFPLLLNGKSYVRPGLVGSKTPNFIFLAVPNSSEGTGVVDVLSMVGGTRQDTDGYTPGVQSIPASGATYLCDYWRQ